jgi:hypothetical protein
MAVNLVNRVQKIIVSPKSEWDVIDKEPTDVTGTLTTYVAPLVILSAVAAAAGLIIFGINIGFGLVVRPSITTVLIQAVLQVVLGVVSVYILAFVIDALAPTFGAQKNFNQAFKVAAFSPTPAWIGGILAIVPAIGWIGSLVGGIYALYLLFVGLPKLMKPPADKGVVYTIVVIVVLIVIYLIIGFIVAKVAMSFAPTPTIGGNFGGIQVAP